MSDTREPNKLHRYSPQYTLNTITGCNNYEGMASFPDGKYVLFADYDKLRRQLAEAEAKLVERDAEVERQIQLRHATAMDALTNLERAELAESKLALAEQDARRLRGTLRVMSAEMNQWAAEASARAATNYIPAIIGWADRMGNAAIAAGEGKDD